MHNGCAAALPRARRDPPSPRTTHTLPPSNALPSTSPCRHRGYDGDGKTCTADPAALQALTSLYWSEPQGLACDAGDDVAWPTSAPGEQSP